MTLIAVGRALWKGQSVEKFPGTAEERNESWTQKSVLLCLYTHINVDISLRIAFVICWSLPGISDGTVVAIVFGNFPEFMNYNFAV